MEESTVEWAKQFAEMGRTIYEQMGYNEFIPTLFYKNTAGETVIVGMMGVPTGYMYDAVMKMISELEGDPDVIALTCDAYSDETEFEGVKSDEEFQKRLATRIPLAQRFANGDPNVKESLNTLVLSASGVITVNQTYKWTPVDEWEWDEPRVMEDGTSDWKWDRLVNGLPREELSYDVVSE